MVSAVSCFIIGFVIAGSVFFSVWNSQIDELEGETIFKYIKFLRFKAMIKRKVVPAFNLLEPI